MNRFALMLPLLLAQFAGQEAAFAKTHVIEIMTKENARVGSPLTTDEIAGVADSLTKLALAEQTKLVAQLTGASI